VAAKDAFMEAARQFLFENYCRIHQVRRGAVWCDRVWCRYRGRGDVNRQGGGRPYLARALKSVCMWALLPALLVRPRAAHHVPLSPQLPPARRSHLPACCRPSASAA
jgi:hypothetical protein